MKKINYLILLFILFTCINGCAGYKPIFISENLQFEIANHSIKGDKILGGKIYSKLYNLSKYSKDNPDKKSISITIEATKNKNATVKNSSGEITEYKIILNTNVKVINYLTNTPILSQNFISSTSYKVQSQYSDTIDLENRSIDDLIDNTYRELLIKLSESIK